MIPIDAKDAFFEHISIKGHDFWRSTLRIKNLPDGWYTYDLRDADDPEDVGTAVATIEPKTVWVNYDSTVISRKPYIFEKVAGAQLGDIYNDITDDDIDFLDDEKVLKGSELFTRYSN